MKEKAYPEFRLDSFSLINFILKYWKVYLITGLLAAVISSIVSLTIEPKYSAGLVLYPSSNIIEPATRIFSDGSVNESAFGDEEAVEKILQILQSDQIKDRLVEKYDLFEHYGIGEEEKYRNTILDRILVKNIEYEKTRFMSVSIRVIDRDPVIAAAMANDIAIMIDSTFNRLIKSSGEKHLIVLEKQLASQYELISMYEDSLELIRRDKLNNSGHSGSSESRINDLAVYGTDFVRLSENHEQALIDLGLIRQKLTETRIAAREDFPYTLIINEARVPEKKALPRRTLIVALTTISTLLFVLLVLIFIEGISIRKKEIDNEGG